MQKSIVWEGLANDTEEHCSVNYLDSGITIRSEIEGWAEGKAVYVEYVLHLDKGWRAMQIEMDFHVSDHQHSYHFKRDEHNNWTDNAGKEYPDLHGCDFVDIHSRRLPIRFPLMHFILRKVTVRSSTWCISTS